MTGNGLNITEHEGKLVLCENQTDPEHYWIRWRAGKVVTEERAYIAPGMVYAFRGTVSLFHVIGYGETREDAIAMARKRKGHGAK